MWILCGRYDRSLAGYETAAGLEPQLSLIGVLLRRATPLHRPRRPSTRHHRASQPRRTGEPSFIASTVPTLASFLFTPCAAHAYDSIADQQDLGEGVAGAAIAFHDLALMHSAGIRPSPNTQRRTTSEEIDTESSPAEIRTISDVGDGGPPSHAGERVL